MRLWFPNARAAPAMALLGLLYPIALSAVAQEARSEIAVDGKFDGKKGGQATDLSGIACRPEDESGYSCVVVNDESPFAQFATLRNGRLIAGFKVDLLAGRGRRLADETPPSGVFGSEAAGRPIVAERCSDRKIESDFDEFDGEGVAWAPTGSGGIFYVVGSHACSRSSGTRRRSTHLLARISVDRAGQVSGEPELTWRLGQALRRANFVAGHYGLLLNASQQGLDIEGVAALNGGEDLLFGLRAPSLDGHGFMVRARAADFFADTSAPPPTAHVVRLQLGERVGIRDLAALPDGRVLVLTGSAQEQSGVPQRLALVSPTEEPLWTMQTLLPEVALPRPESKVEGVAVLGVAADRVRVLVLFEDVSKDLPVEYALILPDR